MRHYQHIAAEISDDVIDQGSFQISSTGVAARPFIFNMSTEDS
jgi:hypothetical protein